MRKWTHIVKASWMRFAMDARRFQRRQLGVGVVSVQQWTCYGYDDDVNRTVSQIKQQNIQVTHKAQASLRAVWRIALP